MSTAASTAANLTESDKEQFVKQFVRQFERKLRALFRGTSPRALVVQLNQQRTGKPFEEAPRQMHPMATRQGLFLAGLTVAICLGGFRLGMSILERPLGYGQVNRLGDLLLIGGLYLMGAAIVLQIPCQVMFGSIGVFRWKKLLSSDPRLCEQYVELIRRVGDDAVLAVDRPLRIADLALALEIEEQKADELEAAALQRTADARKAQLDRACAQAHALVKTSSVPQSS